MAVGDISKHGAAYAIEILTAATEDNGPPSGTGVGIAVSDIVGETGAAPQSCSLELYGTASGGTLTTTLRIWGYSGPAGAWMPLGPGTGGVAAGAGVSGILNQGQALDEIESNKLQHSEPLDLPGHFERIYLELLSTGGTSPSISAWLVWQPAVGGV